MVKRNCGIYCLHNIINNKRYIGQSVNIPRRIKEHINLLDGNNHYNTHLQRSWDKHGGENFEISTLINCSEEELDFYEVYFIKFFNSQNYGYNISEGGHQGPRLKNDKHGMWRHDIENEIIEEMYLSGKRTEEIEEYLGCSRRTIERRLTKILGKEKYNKIRNQRRGESNKGRKMYEENKKLMSQRMKGRKLSQNQINAIKKTHTGKNVSLETRMKMSETQNTTGFFRVHIHKCEQCEQGFRYFYQYRKDNKPKTITSINLLKLKNKVISEGLPWKITDEEKAKKTMQNYRSSHKTKLIESPFWESSKVEFSKRKFETEECLDYDFCFNLKFNNNQIDCGEFLDFVTPTIIYDLIEESVEKSVKKRNLGKSIKRGFDEETLERIFKQNEFIEKNNIKYFGVSKKKRPRYKTGCYWTYSHFENNTVKYLSSMDIKELEKRVIEKGWVWKEVKYLEEKENERSFKISQRRTKSGIFNVSCSKQKNGKIVWRYRYYDDGNKRRSLSSPDLIHLKKRILEKNLPWVILDDDKANESFKLNASSENPN